jgi:hypothetical protein
MSATNGPIHLPFRTILKRFVAETEMLRDPGAAEIVNHKRAEHSAMLARAKDASVMWAFLDTAPDRITFEMIKAALHSNLIIKPA